MLGDPIHMLDDPMHMLGDPIHMLDYDMHMAGDPMYMSGDYMHMSGHPMHMLGDPKDMSGVKLQLCYSIHRTMSLKNQAGLPGWEIPLIDFWVISLKCISLILLINTL